MAKRKRERKLSVYLLDEEWEILEAKKDEAGLTKSDYVRNMILFGSAKERTNFSKEDSKKIIYELSKIGTNLNQIAIKANMNNSLDMEQFINVYDSYMDILSAFRKFAKRKGELNNGDN